MPIQLDLFDFTHLPTHCTRWGISHPPFSSPQYSTWETINFSCIVAHKCLGPLLNLMGTVQQQHQKLPHVPSPTPWSHLHQEHITTQTWLVKLCTQDLCPGSGDMAQSVTGLLNKHEDLSSGLQHPPKDCVAWLHLPVILPLGKHTGGSLELTSENPWSSALPSVGIKGVLHYHPASLVLLKPVLYCLAPALQWNTLMGIIPNAWFSLSLPGPSSQVVHVAVYLMQCKDSDR